MRKLRHRKIHLFKLTHLFFFKVFIEFVTILLLFYVLIFWHGCEACEILAPRPGIEPATPALEGEVLTTGLPGNSLSSHIFNHVCFCLLLYFIILFSPHRKFYGDKTLAPLFIAKFPVSRMVPTTE